MGTLGNREVVIPLVGGNIVAQVYGWPVLTLGLTAGGILVPQLVGPDGSQSTTQSGSGLPYGADYAGYTLNGDGNPTVIVFNKGGSGGTLLKTRTIAYSGTNITSITDA